MKGVSGGSWMLYTSRHIERHRDSSPIGIDVSNSMTTWRV
jgi:hypothetical protein